SMTDSFTAAPGGSAARSWPAAREVPQGRITVAVAVSNEGSAATDVMAPYQVFAESGKFFVYTVAAERRVPTSLGVTVWREASWGKFWQLSAGQC
ncbi:hypothetical protein, partial [Streptomyces sp. NPDC001508]|uniref:hypothetical protein n=1 Tax=Streptomyces sp. NPDC001508 TaxID=3154656 RepID=UPI00332FCC6B